MNMFGNSGDAADVVVDRFIALHLDTCRNFNHDLAGVNGKIPPQMFVLGFTREEMLATFFSLTNENRPNLGKALRLLASVYTLKSFVLTRPVLAKDEDGARRTIYSLQFLSAAVDQQFWFSHGESGWVQEDDIEVMLPSPSIRESFTCDMSDDTEALALLEGWLKDFDVDLFKQDGSRKLNKTPLVGDAKFLTGAFLDAMGV